MYLNISIMHIFSFFNNDIYYFLSSEKHIVLKENRKFRERVGVIEGMAASGILAVTVY